MSDIFISYSSKDREEAERLTELLSSAGLSVWIDKSGIDAATSWSKEIVEAINGCKVFIILLSPASLTSHNVIKEVSLASEKRKKILPLDLEPVTLTSDFEYQLAGIQRSPLTNIDAIIRAIGKMGLLSTKPPELKIVKESGGKKSLMILPFEDLSPTGDNGWFADGLATELISALAPVKALRVFDQQATKDYKRFQGTLPNYAREMSIRYFVQGAVRKFGDQIKIDVTLLDIESGDHLWQDAMKGTMDDIFDIQEKVAEKVVEGLKVHLASGEIEKLSEHGTENPEAYELFLKADEYFDRHTGEGFQLAIGLYSEAIKLDPEYAQAYSSKALALANIYRNYRPDPALLGEGLSLVKEALRLKPDLWSAYYPLSHILSLQGSFEEGEKAALEYVRNDPEDFMSHYSLAFFYSYAGQDLKAMTAYEQALKLQPENINALFNLVFCCHKANEIEKRTYWAEVALPLFEKHLKLFPDDEMKRTSRSGLLLLSGRRDEAREAASKLDNFRDGVSLHYNACLLCALEDYEAAITCLRRAIDAGFRNIKQLKRFLEEDMGGIGKLKGTPEHEEVKRLVEQLSEP